MDMGDEVAATMEIEPARSASGHGCCSGTTCASSCCTGRSPRRPATASAGRWTASASPTCASGWTTWRTWWTRPSPRAARCTARRCRCSRARVWAAARSKLLYLTDPDGTRIELHVGHAGPQRAAGPLTRAEAQAPPDRAAEPSRRRPTVDPQVALFARRHQEELERQKAEQRAAAERRKREAEHQRLVAAKDDAVARVKALRRRDRRRARRDRRGRRRLQGRPRRAHRVRDRRTPSLGRHRRPRPRRRANPSSDDGSRP